MKSSEIFTYKCVEDFIAASGREYSDQMAEVLLLGLVRDASFYEWLILNFNEIMDKDSETVDLLFSKALFIKSFYENKDPEGLKEGRLFEIGVPFAKSLFEYFDNKLSYGECWGLGIIASSYISYQREMLSKEEFYEIRDMFVPFGLTISLDPFDVEAVFDKVKELPDFENFKSDFPLLKKIGKASYGKNVTEEEIIGALKQLIVEWD